MSKKKVLYIVEDTKSAQFRYRVQNVILALEKSFKWEAEWILKSDISKADLSKVDLVVILRQAAKDGEILDFIRKAKGAKIKVLFDLDDLIFDYRNLPILMKSTNSKNIFYWVSYVWGIRRIAKKVDGFITTNGFLAKKLKQTFKKPCVVIFNSLNKKQVEVAKECMNNKEHKGFVIGYFSGSPTHARDLKLVESEIFEFLDKRRDARFEIVGFVEPSFEMKKRIAGGQVKVLKLMDYLEQIKTLSRVDVNIAPLLINDFTNSKSELKFFEAAVVKTATIASPTYVFKKAIQDGKNGFLAKPGEWGDKLNYIYNNLSENKKIAEEARKYALDNYYGEKFLRDIEEAYGKISK